MVERDETKIENSKRSKNTAVHRRRTQSQVPVIYESYKG